MVNFINGNNISLIDLLLGENSKEKTFSKLSDKSNSQTDILEINNERLSYYSENINSTQTLLDAINFHQGYVAADTNSQGYFSFSADGSGQAIPMSALNRIDVSSLNKLYSSNNSLNLSSNSYYSYTAVDGNSYACAFNGSTICRAFTESILGDDMNNVSKECRGNTVNTMSILSSLASGSVGGLHMFERETVKDCLANIGIESGEFNITVDGDTKTYYLGEDGSIYTQERAQKIVAMYNSQSWLNGREVGDKIMVFGKEYEIDEKGYLNVPTTDFWENENCSYGDI